MFASRIELRFMYLKMNTDLISVYLQCICSSTKIDKVSNCNSSELHISCVIVLNVSISRSVFYQTKQLMC